MEIPKLLVLPLLPLLSSCSADLYHKLNIT